MGVLATFDAEGRWADTHVCDGRIAEQLAGLGVVWGRWPDPESLPATVFGSRQAELAQLRERFSAQSIERVRLEPHTATWPALRRQWRAEHRREGVEVRCVLSGTHLLYLRTGDGFVGVLCEAGEWVALPAGSSHSFDAGEAPELDLLRLWSGDAAAPMEAASGASASLPSLDAFVETMLVLTGHAADDE